MISAETIASSALRGNNLTAHVITRKRQCRRDVISCVATLFEQFYTKCYALD